MADRDGEEKTIADASVVKKYKLAGSIVNQTLKLVVEKCKEDASARDICIFGDKALLEEAEKCLKKKKNVKNGIAFPTCVSVNSCICHFSPIPSEKDYQLKNEDVVKIDLGYHVDGFIAVAAHTVVVGMSTEKPVTGRRADVITAAHLASEAALRLVKPGNETYSVTNTVQKVAEAYKCKPIEGMLSHELKQYKIDGEKTIIQNPTDAQKKGHEKFQFELYEVYAVDMLISSGAGVGKELDTRVSVYKKTDEQYSLKLRASRTFFSSVIHKYGNMPFNLRDFEEEKKAKLGIIECVNHKLIEPFQVLYEKLGQFVAQFKFTVLLLPDGSLKITGLPFESDLIKSEYKIEDPELTNLLNTPASPDTEWKLKKEAEESMAAAVNEPPAVEKLHLED